MTTEERMELYQSLEMLLNDTENEYLQEDCDIDNYGEGMKVLEKIIMGWWKPIILIDTKAKAATIFINPEDETLVNVKDEDIDWESVKGLGEDCINRIKNRDAHFPTNIRGFRKGIAEVEWQVSPDGMYYMDCDGFGMSDDEEISLIGYIDRNGNVVRPFTYRR